MEGSDGFLEKLTVKGFHGSIIFMGVIEKVFGQLDEVGAVAVAIMFFLKGLRDLP